MHSGVHFNCEATHLRMGRVMLSKATASATRTCCKRRSGERKREHCCQGEDCDSTHDVLLELPMLILTLSVVIECTHRAKAVGGC